jgi:hypothetical protein
VTDGTSGHGGAVTGLARHRFAPDAWLTTATASAIADQGGGASVGSIRARELVLVLAVPFVPLARVAVTVWPHLPDAVQDFLEGNVRGHRRARLQPKQAR